MVVVMVIVGVGVEGEGQGEKLLDNELEPITCRYLSSYCSRMNIGKISASRRDSRACRRWETGWWCR